MTPAHVAASSGANNAQGIVSGRDTILLTGGTLIQASAPTGITPLHQLSSPPAHFTGRDDDLGELLKQLSLDGVTDTAITCKGLALQGMGGVGKTAFATVLAHRLIGRYPDAQLYLNLRGVDPNRRHPVKPTEVMQSIVHSFHPEARLPDDLEKLTPIYLSVMAKSGRIILLLDNAADVDQVRPLLPPPNCLLLVTSRAQFSLPGLVARNINCLAPAKSQELLLKLAPRLAGYEADAAELCGHLPLALEVFSGAVNDKNLFPVSELLERLRSRQDWHAPVEAAFQVSYQLLSEELQKCWTLLAVFPASFDLLAAASVWGSGCIQLGTPGGANPNTVDAARASMQTLVNASLVEYNEADRRLRLHDLVRQFCNRKLTDAERDGGKIGHARHYQEVGTKIEQLHSKGAENMLISLATFDRERVHLEAAFACLQSRNDQESHRILILLVEGVANAGYLRFHPHQRIIWSEAELNSARKIHNRRNESNALGNIGLAYADLGDPRRAISYYELSLVMVREIGDQRGEGVTLNNLGLAYSHLGYTHKAVECYEKALAIARKIGDRCGEGCAFGNLGSASLQLGEPRKALGFYELGLSIVREIGDQRGEGSALGNLGHLYIDLGDRAKAITFYEQALAIARQIGDRRAEGNSLGSLGSVYFDWGDPQKACDFYEQRLSISREIGDRYGEVVDVCNLGGAYAVMGDTRKAIECYEHSLLMAREIGDPRGELNTLGHLGVTYGKLGDLRKAMAFSEQALALARKIKDPRGEGSALLNCAVIFDLCYNQPQAIKLAEEALCIFESIGVNNEAVARAFLQKFRG